MIMKMMFLNRVLILRNHKSFIMLCLFLFAMTPGYSQSGEDAASDDSDTKLSLRMSFDIYKVNDDFKLVAKARSKIDGRYQWMSEVPVGFYLIEGEEEQLLGEAATNERGEAIFLASADQVSVDFGSVSFRAAVENQDKFEDADKTAEVQLGIMSMELHEEDNIKTIDLFVGIPDSTGELVPLEDVNCQVYVQRLFGKLPVGDPETTDEEGRISIAFPDDIPGDALGHLTIIAGVSEHDVIGSIAVTKDMAWGQATLEDDFYTKRALWSARSNSPVSLIIVVNTVLIGVWGAIVFIFLEIYRINKLGKAS